MTNREWEHKILDFKTAVSDTIAFTCGSASCTFSSSASGTYSKISAGWQSRARHSASRVLSLTAFAWLFLRMERFASVMPTFSESSFSDILRFAIMTSRLIRIMVPPSDREIVFGFDASGFFDHVFDHAQAEARKASSVQELLK